MEHPWPWRWCGTCHFRLAPQFPAQERWTAPAADSRHMTQMSNFGIHTCNGPMSSWQNTPVCFCSAQFSSRQYIIIHMLGKAKCSTLSLMSVIKRNALYYSTFTNTAFELQFQSLSDWQWPFLVLSQALFCPFKGPFTSFQRFFLVLSKALSHPFKGPFSSFQRPFLILSNVLSHPVKGPVMSFQRPFLIF